MTFHTFNPAPLRSAIRAGRVPSPRDLRGSTSSPLCSQVFLAIAHKTDIDPDDVADQVRRVSGLPCRPEEVLFFLGLLVDARLAIDLHADGRVSHAHH